MSQSPVHVCLNKLAENKWLSSMQKGGCSTFSVVTPSLRFDFPAFSQFTLLQK